MSGEKSSLKNRKPLIKTLFYINLTSNKTAKIVLIVLFSVAFMHHHEIRIWKFQSIFEADCLDFSILLSKKKCYWFLKSTQWSTPHPRKVFSVSSYHPATCPRRPCFPRRLVARGRACGRQTTCRPKQLVVRGRAGRRRRTKCWPLRLRPRRHVGRPRQGEHRAATG